MAYLPLSTANLPDPAIDPAQDVSPRDYFDTFLYTGNGAGLQVGDLIKKPADTIDISSSLIFNQPDTAYLSRTPSASTETNSATTFTVSCWFKPTANGTNYQNIWMAGDSGTANRTFMRYNSSADDKKILVASDDDYVLTTPQQLLDTSRWYHIVVAVDTRSSVTQADRVKVWIDGVQQALTGTLAGADVGTRWNQNKLHYIGNSTYTSGRNLDGYLAEFHNVDGTAYTADDFGTFDANGIWIPQTPSVTYGANGFYLDFSSGSYTDNGSDPDVFADQAGSNDWNAYNFEASDIVSDSPTNNFYTLAYSTEGDAPLSEGNLRVGSTTDNYSLTPVALPKTGKWFFEMYVDSLGSSWAAVGLQKQGSLVADGGLADEDHILYTSNQRFYPANTTYVSYGSTFTTGDTIGVAVNMDDNQITFYIDGASQGVNTVSALEQYDWVAKLGIYNAAGTVTANFGQRPFYGTDGSGTLPEGYLALSEDNITVDDQNLESPDLVWIKNRDAADSHQVYDSVRGVQKVLVTDPDTNPAEADAPNGLLDFNANGFTIGSQNEVNTSGEDYVAWCWKAPTSFSNGAGENGATIASSGKVSTESGFSIVSYTTTTNAADTVAHGLNSKPEFIITKDRGNNINWFVFTDVIDGSIDTLNLNLTGGKVDQSGTPSFSDTVFTTNYGAVRNTIAYCFHSVEGFSKFASYRSNGNVDGPFVYCGFRPSFVLIKRTISGDNWVIYDSVRDTYNAANAELYPSASSAEASTKEIDFLSNGFKIRASGGLTNGTTASDYIYMAFAENPFKYSNAR
jgi:hypothetical protein